MGLSSNQARFLSLTARQIDMEQRVQQICQRRLRLSSELENIATRYNNAISNRRMYTPNLSGLENISVGSLASLGYSIMRAENKTLLGDRFLPVYQLPSSDVQATGQVNAITSLDAGLKTVEYMDLKTKTMVSAIGIYSADALKALSGNQSTAGVLSSNYILMSDVDLGGFNWESLGDNTNQFTGNFNANEYTISNLNINGTSNLGLFGTIGSTGKVENININGVNITAGVGATEIGALAAINNGTIDNADVSNINISVTGALGSTAIATLANGGPHCIGGLVGGNNGSVDKVSTQGKIIINTTSALDGVGALIGTNGSTSSLISSSYVDLDILTNSPDLQCVNTFVGCDAIAGNYKNCYSTGMIYNLDGVTTQADTAYQNTYFTGHNSGSVVSNCYKRLSNGSYAYWNGTQDNFRTAVNNTFNPGGGAWTDSVNGVPVWDTKSTPPSVNLDSINTYWYDGEDPSEQELQEGLRNGTYYLVKPADEFTQSPIKFNGFYYESIDWRQSPEIFDELFRGDDVEAENKYDKIVSEINAQDKKLQLEQTSVEMEYKAVASEREAVKKILDTNAQSSFKYFS